MPILHTCPTCGTRYWSERRWKRCSSSQYSRPLFPTGATMEAGKLGIVEVDTRKLVPDLNAGLHRWVYECTALRQDGSAAKLSIPEGDLYCIAHRN